MCMKNNALAYAALAVAAIYTGGAALGAWGGAAAAGTAGGAAASGAAAGTATTAAAGTSWGTYASMASAAMSAYGAYQGAQAQRDMAKYNEAVARNNATMAEYQAQDAISRGNAAAEEHSRKVAALVGTQRNSMAARGLDISEGTPLDIVSDTETLGSIDQRTIKTNAEKEAWSARVQSGNYANQAGMYKLQAENTSPLMVGAGSLLSGAASVADKWYRDKWYRTSRGIS